MTEKPKSIVALIPARGGSKRIPGKNIRELNGHPLIAYTIAAARSSRIFSQVIVSTDDDRTSEIAVHYGAEVPWLRPKEFSGDQSPDIEWVKFTLERLRSEGSTFQAFSLLRPTSPFRKPETIQRAWTAFQRGGDCDSLRAVEKCREHPGKMWILESETRMRPLLEQPATQPWHSTPYQALPPVYVQNASLEMAWTSTVLKTGTIAGAKICPFLTEGYEGFDLNRPEDWILAEHFLKKEGVGILPAVNL